MEGGSVHISRGEGPGVGSTMAVNRRGMRTTSKEVV